MKAVISGHGDTRDVGTLPRVWEGVIAVLLGIAVGLALRPLINDMVLELHSALTALGMTADAATVTIYWLGMIAIGAGFLVAFNGPEALVSRLRIEVGEWAAILVDALTAALAVVLWLTAAATWVNFEDEFNAYGPGTELSAVGVMVLLVAAAVVLRWMRHRRSAGTERPS